MKKYVLYAVLPSGALPVKLAVFPNFLQCVSATGVASDAFRPLTLMFSGPAEIVDVVTHPVSEKNRAAVKVAVIFMVFPQ